MIGNSFCPIGTEFPIIVMAKCLEDTNRVILIQIASKVNNGIRAQMLVD